MAIPKIDSIQIETLAKLPMGRILLRIWGTWKCPECNVELAAPIESQERNWRRTEWHCVNCNPDE